MYYCVSNGKQDYLLAALSAGVLRCVRCRAWLAYECWLYHFRNHLRLAWEYCCRSCLNVAHDPSSAMPSHIQRLCQTLITTRPKTEAGHMLLCIARELNYLHNHYEVRIWKNWLSLWEKRYGALIKERTYGKNDDGSCT